MIRENQDSGFDPGERLGSMLRFSDRTVLLCQLIVVAFAAWLWFYMSGREVSADEIANGAEQDDWAVIGNFAAALLVGYAILHAAWAILLLNIKPHLSLRLPQSLLLFCSGVLPVFLGVIGLLTGDDAISMMKHTLQYWVVIPYAWIIGWGWIIIAFVRQVMANGK